MPDYLLVVTRPYKITARNIRIAREWAKENFGTHLQYEVIHPRRLNSAYIPESAERGRGRRRGAGA
jgi:hypothetical protein